jgi:hypothetical protein
MKNKKNIQKPPRKSLLELLRMIPTVRVPFGVMPLGSKYR